MILPEVESVSIKISSGLLDALSSQKGAFSYHLLWYLHHYHAWMFYFRTQLLPEKILESAFAGLGGIIIKFYRRSRPVVVMSCVRIGISRNIRISAER